MQDQIGPFLTEFRRVQHHFVWQVDPKSGRIVGKHAEYYKHFTPMEAVAWGEKGEHFGGDYEAARAVNLSEIVVVVQSACNHWNSTRLRKSILELIGLNDKR